MAQARAIFAAEAPPIDGRQSPRALDIRRGMGRYLRSLGFSLLPEMGLANGRRADLMALDPKGSIWIFEIKSSVADFRTDTKWLDYLGFCDRFGFATSTDVPAAIFPGDAGLYIADAYGAHCLREATEQRLAPARRKALLLAFARASANRLLALEDPELGSEAFR
jgi:hypothetical protein